jgi:hypothetical protein
LPAIEPSARFAGTKSLRNDRSDETAFEIERENHGKEATDMTLYQRGNKAGKKSDRDEAHGAEVGWRNITQRSTKNYRPHQFLIRSLGKV